MKPLLYYFLLVSSPALLSCRGSSLVTTWESPERYTANYHTILVLGIVQDDDTLLRSNIEHSLTKALRAEGYNAVAALRAFGEHGLKDLGLEQTLITLCNQGFDVVLTVAAVDAGVASKGKQEMRYDQPAHYLLDRIWHYESILADFTGLPSKGESFFWETIFFDLYALEPRVTIHSKTYYVRGHEPQFDIARPLVTKLKKARILKKPPVSTRQWAAVPK